MKYREQPADKSYMQLALRLAARGKGTTYPNPMVGAVVALRNKTIACGYHKKAGRPHAEVIVLDKAGRLAKGATLYVTLEPCSSYGRTPPCTNKIIEAGISRVVIAAADVNPKNSQKGIKELRKSGIDVSLGLMEKEANKLNEAYIKYMKAGRPFISLKLAQSIDGKIAARSGDSRWITNKRSRQHVHKLRTWHDGVMVGIETLLKDDPRLDCRLFKPAKRQPKKIILDSALRTPRNANIFKTGNLGDIYLVTTAKAPAEKIKYFEKKGVNVVTARKKHGFIDLKDALQRLGRLGIVSVLAEGGSKVADSLLSASLADKLYIFIAPIIVGDKAALGYCSSRSTRLIEEALRLKNVSYKRFEDNILIEAYL